MPNPRADTGAPSLGRVRQACLRCHKQKLRCDNERPCTLCKRSVMECKEKPSNFSRRRRFRSGDSNLHSKSDAANPHAENLDLDRALPQTPEFPPSVSCQSAAPSPSSSSSRNEVPYQERPSAYGLVKNIFENSILVSGVSSIADAIPDGSSNQRIASHRDRRVPVFDLIGMELPSPDIVNLFLDSYLKSIHWFIMVVHKPSLKCELDEIAASGTVQQSRLSLLTLIMVILAFGSNYTSDDDIQKLCPGFDRHCFERKQIRKVEEKFLNIFDEADIESVQTGVLLSSYYSYFGQPKRGYIVFGSTWTCAKALGLHRESMWGPLDALSIEIRRRVWWTVYAGDVFGAINFGRPCTINDTDWDVKMVRNIDDTSITCPGFQSMEALGDRPPEPVTILTYQRCKYKLYQIASSILKSLYFNTGATVREIATKVEVINKRLVSWERDIPPELKLTSFRPDNVDVEAGDILETFQLQALALHLFYNNVQLLLNRPLLAYTRLPRQHINISGATPVRSSKFNLGANVPASTFVVQVCQSSRNQCWESAIQTSKIIEYRHLLVMACNTPVAPYIGIQTFTAGAILGLFALSVPLTAVAQDAKRALGRLIKIPQVLGSHNLVSKQCGNILKELVGLILSEEMRTLTSEEDFLLEEQLPKTAPHQNILLTSQSPVQSWETSHGSANDIWPNVKYSHQYLQPMAGTQALSTITNTSESPMSRAAVGTTYERAFECGSEDHTKQDFFLEVATEDFNHAVTSLRTVFRDERSQMNGNCQISHDGNNTMNSFASTASNDPSAEMIFDDTCQTWIWGDDFNFL